MSGRFHRCRGVFNLCLLSFLLPMLYRSAHAAKPDSPAVLPGEHQLFFDDLGLEKTQGIHRNLRPAVRSSSNPVLTADQPWEHYCSQYGTVLFDRQANLFRMWYLTLPRDRGLKPLDLGQGRSRAPHTTLVGYGESPDGLHWTKPNLGLFPFDGNDQNNLLTLGVDNCEGLSVLHEPHDPDPTRRFKAIYWDHGSGGYEERDGKPFSKDGPRDGLYAATSADGIHWKGVSDGPVIAKYCDTQQNLLFDTRLKRYVAFSRFGMGRVLARSESADLVHWSAPELVLQCDAEDGPGAQIYGAAIDFYEGVYLAMLAIYHEGTDATIDTQLATSRDGIHWTRVAERRVWLPLGDAESWEGGMVRTAPHVIHRGDELFVFYGGVHGAHNRPGHPAVVRKHRGAIGLAVARRDRFVSLDSADEGWILTKPFQLPAGLLHLNLEAPSGDCRVELCEAESPAVLVRSLPITGDTLDATIKWEDDGSTAAQGKTVRLRFQMRQAKLFSYWFDSN